MHVPGSLACLVGARGIPDVGSVGVMPFGFIFKTDLKCTHC